MDKIKVYEELLNRALDSLKTGTFCGEERKEADKLYDDIKSALSKPETETDDGWISVHDRLPKEYEQVLLVAEVTNSLIYLKTDRVITIGRLKPSGKWQMIGENFLDMEITHWRTLPALPKGE